MCSFQEVGKLDLLPVCVCMVALALLKDKALCHCFMYYVLIHKWEFLGDKY